MSKNNTNIKNISYSIIISSILIIVAIFLSSSYKASYSQGTNPETCYLVWSGGASTWEGFNIPMTSTTAYYFTKSPAWVKGNNIGIGTNNPSQKLDVAGNIKGFDIIGNRLCIGNDCRDSWPLGGGGEYWAASGDNIYNTNPGYVGIGIGKNTPLLPLDVAGITTSEPVNYYFNGPSLEPFKTASPDNTGYWKVINNVAKAVITKSPGTAVLYLTTTIESPGVISFDLSFKRNTTSNNFTALTFFIDNQLKNTWDTDTNWTRVTYNVTPGAHTFYWVLDYERIEQRNKPPFENLLYKTPNNNKKFSDIKYKKLDLISLFNYLLPKESLAQAGVPEAYIDNVTIANVSLPPRSASFDGYVRSNEGFCIGPGPNPTCTKYINCNVCLEGGPIQNGSCNYQYITCTGDSNLGGGVSNPLYKNLFDCIRIRLICN